MEHLQNPIFQHKAKARKWLESHIWPDGAVCPHCGSLEPTKLEGKAHRDGLYQCNDCRQQFTVTVGTLMAVFLLSSSKKGISTNQLSRMLSCPTRRHGS